MNANCIICNDVLSGTEVYATQCGHVFHYVCLIQWLERSKTCPQCRHRATQNNIHRLYLNVSNDENLQNPAFLQNKIDNLQLQLTTNTKEFNELREKLKLKKEENNWLKSDLKKCQEKYESKKVAVEALKIQIGFLKASKKECDKLRDELKKVKDDFNGLKNVSTAISGSKDEVDDLLRHNNNPETLTLLVTALKKELNGAEMKRKQLKKTLERTQAELQTCRREKEKLTERNNKLKLDVEEHKNCNVQRQYLKRKLTNVSETVDITGDTSLVRILEESPAPLARKQRKLDEEANSGGDSPYLPVKSNSIAFLFSSSTTFCKLKLNPSKSSEEISFNGLGGHSKEDSFPIAKRPKVASFAKLKLKKLAPNVKKGQ